MKKQILPAEMRNSQRIDKNQSTDVNQNLFHSVCITLKHLNINAKILAGIFFLLMSVTAFGQVNYFSKAAATDFTDVNSWGTNADGSGSSPASITNADNYTIQNSSVMNLNAGNASVRQLSILSGSLTIGSNTLTVSRSTGNNSTLSIAGGTLTVNGGTIILNGNFSMTSGTFNQGGGSIVVDGNDNNTAASSVASGTHLFLISGGTPNCTAGTITIVDPPVNTYATASTRSFNVSLTAGNNYFSGTHTVILGDGVSTTPGNTDGFVAEVYSSGACPIQNLTANGGSAAGRWGSNSYNNSTVFGLFVKGTLTINSGSEFRTTYASGVFQVAGGITNNGTLTFSHTGTPLVLGNFTSGGYIAPSQTVITGPGVFQNATSSPTANYTSVTINNTNGVAFSSASSISGTGTGTISGTLTLTAGAVNLSGGTFTIGISTATLGTLTYTAGGFTTGSTVSRWFAATTAGTTITTGVIPTSGTGSFPFQVGVNSRNFHLQRPTTTGATGGKISVQHVDGTGLNTIGVVNDGGYMIDRQSAANWIVSIGGGFDAGTGTFSYAVSGQGIYTALNTNGRLMKAASVVGTHQAGTILPHVQRTGIAAADYTGTFYFGIMNAELPTQSVQSGPWEDVNTWAGGVVPVCGTSTAIMNGHTVTVNGAAANSGLLIINAGGTLTISGNTLTVGCTNNNTPLNNSGTLNVAGGNLNINGNLAIINGSTFTHSAGTITIDGNDNSGTTGNANSVASGTPLFAVGSSSTAFSSTGSVTLSGGTIIIVDPHIGSSTNTSAYAVYANMASSVFTNASGSHTFQYGDGVSTAAGSSTSGFYVAPFAGSGRLNFNNVTINSAAGTNRNVTQTGTNVINGNLTVTLGTYDQNALTTNVGGNISAATGGTFNATGTTVFCSTAGTTTSAQVNPQSVSVSGSGAINNLAVSPTGNFTTVTINNTSSTGVTFNALNSISGAPASCAIVSTTLTFTAGRASTTGTNGLLWGTVAGGQGTTLTVTSGGMAPGSTFGRFWTSGQTGTAISAGADPTTTTSRFPFANAAGANRSVWIQRVTPSAAGVLTVTYTDASTTSAVSIVDGAYTVETRYDGNWSVGTAGTTPSATSYTMAIVATGAYGVVNGNSRITYASTPVAGTHQNGTTTPGAQRIGLTLSDITSAPLYIGASNTDIPFISVANGSWETPGTWNKNAIPTSSDVVVVANGNTVTVNATPATASLLTVTGILNVSGSTLNVTATASGTGVIVSVTTGQLNISGGTVTVGTGSNRYSTLTDNGTLSVSGTGTLNVNGNVNIASGATFNQSGGNINIDGNAAGVAGNSVATGTRILGMTGSPATISLTGGMITIVDPHVISSDYALYANMSTATNCGTGHTFRFGDGVSTDPGASTGFYVYLFPGSSYLILGNVIANGGSGTNRFVNTTSNIGILGNLTINASSEYRLGSTNTYLAGNLVNNGILTATNTLNFASYAGAVVAATANAQTVSGAGVFQNLTSGATANFTSITINNSNATGVTLSVPIALSGTLTLTQGIVNTTATNYLALGTLTAAGTLSGGSSTAYINGPFARTFAANRTAVGTYSATTLYPVGKSTTYLPIHIDPSTTSGGAVIMSGEAFLTNSGSMGTGVTSLSAHRWEALIAVGASNFTNSFIRLNDAAIAASNKILQAPSAAGAYIGIPAATTYAVGPPVSLTSATSIPSGSYTGYFAYGDLTPCAVPADQPTAFTVTLLGATSFTGSFTAASSMPSNYLVVRYPDPAVETTPVDFTPYTVGASLGAGTVVSISSSTTFNQTGLTAGTTYHYYIYSYNNVGCGGPIYRTPSPLIGNVTTCGSPTGVPGTPTSSMILPTSFQATWTASSTPSVNYELDVATDAGFTSFVSGYNALNVGMVLTYNVSGLTAATTYYVRVRAVISGCYSLNSGTLTVTTACLPISSFPWTDGFESLSSFGAGLVPNCWGTQIVTGTNFTSANTPVRNSLGARTGTNYVWSRWSSDAWLYTPGFDLVGGTSYDFSYYYRQTDAVAGFTITTAYGTAASSGSMTNTLGTIVDPVNTSYVQAIYTFTPAMSGTYYFGVHSVSPTSTPWYMEYDDFKLEASPSCLPPTGLNAVGTGATTATVSWSAPTPAPSNGYEWKIVLTGAGSGGSAVASGSTGPGVTTDNATGLTSGTVYDLFVRSNCGSGVFSAYAGPKTFFLNDDAAGAILLNVGTPCSGNSYTNVGATLGSGELYPSCSGVGVTPVWFKFVAPASGAVRVSTDISSLGTFTDSKIAIYSATTPTNYATFSVISCDDDGGNLGSGFMSVVYATGLISGTTYYVVVDKYDSGVGSGTFCIQVDELNSSMLSTNNICSSTYQTPENNANTTYTGWCPLLDANSKLIALVRNPAGGDVSLYTPAQNINTGPVRSYGPVKYLDRNYLINNTTATNVDVQFFYLNSELTALMAADPMVTASNLGTTKQTGTTCAANFADPNGVESFIAQTSNGVSTDGLVRWIQITTPSFSNFYMQGSTSNPLSVNLLSFTGYKEGTHNILKWTSTNETNNRGYEVQRSSDGVNFISIGFVDTQAPGGTSISNLNYSFMDMNPTGSRQYYRLNQIDQDGKNKLTNIIMIRSEKSATLSIDGLFPNPASSFVNVLVDAPVRDNITVIVLDAIGRTVVQQIANVEEGSNSIPVDISKLSNGSYIVKLICASDCETVMGRFVKQD